MTPNWYLIRYESVNQQIDIIYMIYYQDTTYIPYNKLMVTLLAQSKPI
jgi:hypothetical protein